MSGRNDFAALQRFTQFGSGLPLPARLAVTGVMIAACTWVLVMGGGPPSALVQLFYLPIILAAIQFNLTGGLIAGVVCGIFAGPVAFVLSAHLLTKASTATLGHWLVRAAAMSATGAAFGWAIGYARRQTELSYRDMSTALPNLHGVRRLVHELFQRDRGDTPPDNAVTKAALRVTNYQSVVNAFGHHVADAAMRAVGERLKREIPRDTLLARVSPNTFAILALGTGDRHAARYCDLLARMGEATIDIEGIPIYPDYALGLAETRKPDFDVERLFSDAESAVTEAEQSGSNFVVHDASRRRLQQDRVRLLGEVGSALRAGALTLAYQPRVDLRSYRVNGVEALARWHHPSRGWVSPGEFVPLIEQTRLVDAFTRWILERALEQLGAWLADGHAISMAVNISAHNLAGDWLPDCIDENVRRFGVPASSLELEITESAFMEITPARVGLLRDIQSAGTRIAIDDFGTGYASLAYLRKLPVDVLKLDRSFIQDGLYRRQDHLMVHRIVQMAKDRNLRVVAEGVETEAVLQAVSDLGCDEAQGFFIAPPLPPAEIARKITDRAAKRTGN